MRKLILYGIAALSALSAAGALAAPAAGGWEIGPIIRGKNYSRGMPLSPAPAGNGWAFDFPYRDARAGHVHYVTFAPGSLAGKSRIVARYRVEAAPGARFVAQESAQAPATVSLVLQRAGDNWSARGRYEFYRWYAPASSVREITPGEHEMTVSLDDPAWTSVQGRAVSANPDAFAGALAGASRVGLVFGSHGARGHGVYATAPARFTLLDFRID
jgi:hypothetical protein